MGNRNADADDPGMALAEGRFPLDHPHLMEQVGVVELQEGLRGQEDAIVGLLLRDLGGGAGHEGGEESGGVRVLHRVDIFLRLVSESKRLKVGDKVVQRGPAQLV